MFAPKLYIIRSFPAKIVIDNNSALPDCVSTERKYQIKQQDSQLLRQIRLITKNESRYNKYVFFVDGAGCSAMKDSLPTMIRNGIMADGYGFSFGPRSASMVRNQIYSFIRNDIFDELMKRLKMEMHVGKVVLSKLAAYEGLFFSSGHCVEGFRPKVIVVPDRDIVLHDQHIKYLYDKETTLTNADGQEFTWRQKDIAKGIRDVTINVFDGAGIIHPDLADELQRRIGSKTPVTSAIIRLPYIKGAVHAVDYTAFFHERGVEYIKDIWGKWHSVDDRMLICTKSMYKGFSYFYNDGTSADWDRYWDMFDKYEHCFCIAKWGFSFDEEPAETRASYQILQDLDMDFEQFKQLAEPSIKWVESVVGGDEVATHCFLGLFADRARPVSSYAKSIMKNPAMLNEPSVKKYLRDSIKRYVDDMKAGKIFLKGCFKFLVPDIILMLEHIGGLPLVGSLKSDEFYARDINGPLSGEMLIERSPHIAASEHAILKAVAPPELVKYVGNLSNICVVNGFSLICPRLNGADQDGDLVLVVDSPLMMSGVHKDAYIVINVDDKQTALVEDDTIENRIALALRQTNSLIGKFSNIASCYHNKVTCDPDRKEEYQKRIDILGVQVGVEIDSAKTGVKPVLPKYIEKGAGPLPYFLYWRGDYYKSLKLNKTWSNMNRLAMQIDKWGKRLSWTKSPTFDWRIMIDNSISIPGNVMDEIDAIFCQYNKEVRETLADQRRIRKYEDDDVKEQLSRYDAMQWVADFGEIYDRYKRMCAEVCPDQKMLANICVKLVYEKYPKSRSKFHWVVAERGILENIKQVPVLKLPKRDPLGPYEYLGRRYDLVDVDMTEPELVDDVDEFAEFNDDWEMIDFD